MVLTEPEPDVVVVDLNVRASQPGDAGGGLGVEEQQEGRHPVARFHGFVGEEAACEAPSLVVANEADRVTGWWVGGVEFREESSLLSPAQEAEQAPLRLWSDGQPPVQVALGGLRCLVCAVRGARPGLGRLRRSARGPGALRT